MRKRREKNEAKVTKATKGFGDKKKNKLRMNFLYLLIYFIIIFRKYRKGNNKAKKEKDKTSDENMQVL